MGRTYDAIDDRMAEFLRAQRVFFVGTAPANGGHVNVSPKGLDTFAILGPHTVAYLDLTGSGIETIAHVQENGRITLLFCAFEGPPRIVRLYGTGRVITVESPEFQTRAHLFGSYPSARAILEITVDRIADSCGYGVPQYRYDGDRTQLLDWAARKGADGVIAYRNDNNTKSIDDLPGLRPQKR